MILLDPQQKHFFINKKAVRSSEQASDFDIEHIVGSVHMKMLSEMFYFSIVRPNRASIWSMWTASLNTRGRVHPGQVAR